MAVEVQGPTIAVALPPLQAGDRLTRREFERRYHAMPSNVRAELIEGVVYMSSPVRYANHGRPHFIITTWLGTYTAMTPGVHGSDNTTVRLDVDNDVQPDALLLIDERRGGQSRVTPDDYLEGAPELVVEVAASSASYDLFDKLKVYRRNGIQEYLVWAIYDHRIDWLKFEDGEQLQLQPDAEGVIRSHVFPGLYLNVAALLAEDLARVLFTLQQGLNSPEHAAFVERLSTGL